MLRELQDVTTTNGSLPIVRFLPRQVQSYVEYFQGSCTDAIHWLGDYNYFPGFTEGWTTYIEYELLPQDTNLYSDTSDKEVLLQKYGMIYYQVIMGAAREGFIAIAEGA